jgi:hypothetical protein
MMYYIDLFSPETYETFTKSNQEISGFRQRQETAASRIQPGDPYPLLFFPCVSPAPPACTRFACPSNFKVLCRAFFSGIDHGLFLPTGAGGAVS